MLTYILRRLVSMLLIMLLVGVCVFVITRAVPGDPIAIMLGENASAEDIERMRQQYGLDEPIAVQFVIWFRQVLSGNFGTSLFFGQPVADLILDRAEPTILLSAMALGMAAVIGIPTGVISAVARGRIVDQTILGSAMVAAGIPSFWLGLVLMQYGAVRLGWFPVAGYGPPEALLYHRLAYLVLPALALALPNSALIARMTRGSMLDVLGEDYIRTARAKGVSFPSLYLKHALRNSFVNVLTVLGIIAGALLSGVVVIETVFSLPGLGQLVMSAVLRRDYPTIQGVLIVVAGTYVIVNLVVDLLYAAVDPRIVY